MLVAYSVRQIAGAARAGARAAAIATTCATSTVAIRFEGDYDESYTEGDNSDVLPTDTMKNTVYALAARQPVVEPEAFGAASGASTFSIAIRDRSA